MFTAKMWQGCGSSSRPAANRTMLLITSLLTRRVSQAWVVEVKNLLVRFHRIITRFPGSQSPLEELDPVEMKCQCSTQHDPAGLIAWTGAVNNGIFSGGISA